MACGALFFHFKKSLLCDLRLTYKPLRRIQNSLKSAKRSAMIPKSDHPQWTVSISIQSQPLSSLLNKTLYTFLRRDTHTHENNQNWLLSKSTLSWIFTQVAFITNFIVKSQRFTKLEKTIMVFSIWIPALCTGKRINVPQEYEQTRLLNDSPILFTFGRIFDLNIYAPKSHIMQRGHKSSNYKIRIEKLPHTCDFHVHK
jgi:hypothetical protein